MSFVLLGVLLCCLGGQVDAASWYLPGGIVREYADGDNVDMDVNVMTSVRTHLPYKYYSLPFCQPFMTVKADADTIGEILQGDLIERSPYEFFPMSRDIACHEVCTKNYTKEEMDSFMDRIKDEYSVNLLLDNFPVAVQNVDESTYSLGVPLGVRDSEGRPVLYNHYSFFVKYHLEANGMKRVVGVQARPYSVRHNKTCNSHYDPTSSTETIVFPFVNEVTWSYSVNWERSKEPWGTRWDILLNASHSEVHGWAILNSLLMVLFLTMVVALIMARTLKTDIATYNQFADTDDLPDDTGWKLVHDQVFRVPSCLTLLAAYVGTGVQLIGMTVVVLFFALLGFLSPASRGGLVTATMLCFVLLGVCGGFASARLMKTMGRPSWRNTFLTATMVPGQLLVVFFIVNFFLWYEKSSAAITGSTVAVLLLLWFLVEVPFVFFGSVAGYRCDPISIPVRTATIPRYIPEQPYYLKPLYTVMIGGVLPFGAVLMELFFILTSLWLSQYYYVFGCLFVVFIILIVTCAEVSIVWVYYQLCSEDYNWWWRSFFTSGVSGLYVFLYCVVYFVYSLKITKPVSIVLYFGYMGCVSYIFFVVTGTVGFISAFVFIRMIYSFLRYD